MKLLKNMLDKARPLFEKGGKLHIFHSTFDAFDTFLFVPDKVTTQGVHVRDAIDMKRTMAIVILALLPCLLFGMWNVGYQHFLSTGETKTFWETFFFGFRKVLPMLVVSYGVGLTVEFIFAQVRGHEVNEGYLVTGMLIPLIMPVDVPLWMLAAGVIFAVVIGKEVFGGTGMNILNPALTARAFIFFSYPMKMTGDYVWISGLSQGKDIVDGFSGATPLGLASTGNFNAGTSLSDAITGTIPGSIGETSFIAIMIGALILFITNLSSMRIMISVFAGGLAMGLLFNLIAANEYMNFPAFHHWFYGGFAFGAVFMATDPVTASQTNTGKWIYGFLIGSFAVFLRVLNPAYPEGMMISILLMNLMAPLIDHYIIRLNIKKRISRINTNPAILQNTTDNKNIQTIIK